MTGILGALKLATDHSQILVLTDADCKDCDKNKSIIDQANRRSINIHFFFGTSLCSDAFEAYKHVQQSTGGLYVDTIKSFESLSLFFDKLHPSSSVKRSIYSVDSTLSSSYNCQTFAISIFTTKFKIVVKQNNALTKIYDPLGYIVKSEHISDDLSGYISNEQPIKGSWRICTVNEYSEFSITKQEIVDLFIDYYADGHYSTTIPPAGIHYNHTHDTSGHLCFSYHIWKILEV